MLDKEKAIKKLKEVLDSLDITNKYRLNLIEAIECLQEEPVSEDLNKAASRYAKEEYNRKSPAILPDRCRGCYAPLMYAFKAGAKWGKDQAMAEIKAQSMALVHGCPEESENDDLEEAAEDYGIRQGAELKPFAIKYFKAGAKWQKEQDKETIELAEDHAMLAGMNRMEEQIMNKAKSGIGDKDNYIKFEDDTWLDLDPTMKLKPAFDVKEEDKVKVIIIKED